MKKDQHYVPQFYLKSFCDKSGKLTAFCPKQNELKKIAPNNICFEKNLYETPAKDCDDALGSYINCNDIEDIYGKYESDFATLLRKILAVCSEQNKDALILHSDEKKMFFRFIVNMLIRNPVSMREMKIDTLSNEIKSLNFYTEMDFVLNEMGIGGTESIFTAAQKKAYLTFEFNEEQENQLVEELSSMNFSFFRSQSGEFITSDRPVCYGNDLYIKAENSTCIYMALSPHIAVLFGNYKDSKSARNRMIPISEDVVNKFNHSIVGKKQYYRWLIARSKSAIEKAIKE